MSTESVDTFDDVNEIDDVADVIVLPPIASKIPSKSKQLISFVVVIAVVSVASGAVGLAVGLSLRRTVDRPINSWPGSGNATDAASGSWSLRCRCATGGRAFRRNAASASGSTPACTPTDPNQLWQLCFSLLQSDGNHSL